MLKLISTVECATDDANGMTAPGSGEVGNGMAPPLQGDLGLRMVAEEYKEQYLELARTGIEDLCQKLSVAPAPMAFADGPRTGDQPRKARKTVAALKILRTGTPRKNGLRRELPHAMLAYQRAVDCVRKLMAYASTGRMYSGPVDDVVAGLVDSLERNADALLCMPRLKQRDHYTYTHCVNVSVLLAAFMLAEGESRERAIAYGVAGMMHDLGKALLPVSLLCARRTLCKTEQALVTRHPVLGYELLAEQGNLSDEALLAALEHHERYDGSGYPRGLSGDAISHIGHLAAIADTFDAISSRRPYKGALFPHKSLGIMYQMRQKQFHPELLERFVRMIGIYPVGSIVELKDGYRGVVTASNEKFPTLPVVTLVIDRRGLRMPLHECDLARDPVAAISRCLSLEQAGFDPASALGLPL